MYPSPKISIVVPSFNKVKFIGRTLESIVTQDYDNFEVIIMDGGSSDGTLKIIEKYAKKYPDLIRYQSKKDKGQWDAINKGFNHAKGKILGFINADDVYRKGALSEIARLYKLNIDSLWFAGRGDVIDENDIRIVVWTTRYKNLLLALNFHPFIYAVNYLMQPSVFITKTAWKRFGPFIGYKNFVLEYDLWLKISKIKMPVVTGKYLSNFRIEPNTITKQSSTVLLKEDEKILKKYTSNPVLTLLHKLHNLGRFAVSKFI